MWLLEKLKLHMWLLHYIFIGWCCLALPSEAMKRKRHCGFLKLLSHTIWSKPLFLLMRERGRRQWRRPVWAAGSGAEPAPDSRCPSRNAVDTMVKSTITSWRFPRLHNSMSVTRIKYKWGSNMAEEHTWQPLVLALRSCGSHRWRSSPQTLSAHSSYGSEGAGSGVSLWNFYKKEGCHPQSSVNHSWSGCGMVCGPVLDGWMERE